MSLQDYTVGKVIGKGSYGEVSLAKCRKDRKQFVIKKIDLQKASIRERKAAEQEAKLLSQLRHPNIVSYKESFQDEVGFLYIVMGFCEGGDMYTKLKEQKGVYFEETQIVEWFVQIAMSLQYLHERNILHRDLKTQNIFLTRSKIIKVGDLGIARVLENSSDMATTLIGTPYYMSPELFSNKPYNHKSDVWALGCCLYEMCTLKHAFNARDMNSLVYRILKGKTPAMPKQYTSDLCDIIKTMLHQEPEKRPSVSKLLRQPYIKKQIALFLEMTRKKQVQKKVSRSREGSANKQRDIRKSSAKSSQSNQSDSGYGGSKDPAVATASDIDFVVCDSEKSSASSSDKPQNIINSTPNRPDPRGKYIVNTPKQRQKSANANSERDSVSKASNSPRQGSASSSRQGSADRSSQQGSAGSSRQGSAGSSRQGSAGPKRGQSVEDSPQSSRHKSLSKERSDDVKSRRKSESDYSKNSNQRLEKNKADPAKVRAKIAAQEKTPNAAKIQTPDAAKKQIPDSDKVTPVSRRPLPPKPIQGQGVPSSISPRSRRRFKVATSEASQITNSSSDKPEASEATPSVLSARERRRQKQRQEAALGTPPIGHISEELVAARIRKSQEAPGTPRKENNLFSSPEDVTDGPAEVREEKRRIERQPESLDSVDGDSTGSELEDLSVDEPSYSEQSKPASVKKRRVSEQNDMSNLICAFESTLKLSNDSTSPDPEKEEPAEQPKDQVDAFSSPSASTKLRERIDFLRKDCVDGVGKEVLDQALKIMGNMDEDIVEPQLVDLMGREKFEIYGGRIWQIKFCQSYRV